MNWLTLEKIKAQCRIESGFTDEDSLLTSYGNSAESTIMNLLNKSYCDLTEEYGAIPDDIINASLMLVDVWYKHRSPIESVTMSLVPYTFDILIKPYMRLANSDDNIPLQFSNLGDDEKIVFNVDLPNNMTLVDVDFTGFVFNTFKKDAKVTFNKADCHLCNDGRDYCFMFNSSALGIGRYKMKLDVNIPDTDYPAGYSKKIVKIDPHIYVKG